MKKKFEKFTFLTLGEQKLGRRNCSAIERLITVIPTVVGGVIGPRRLLCNHNSYMITGNCFISNSQLFTAAILITRKLSAGVETASSRSGMLKRETIPSLWSDILEKW